MGKTVHGLSILRNQIWHADLGETEGSEQAGYRPVLIIQNDIGNLHSSTVIVACITEVKSTHIPTHVFIEGGQYQGIHKRSVIMLEQLRTIDKKRLTRWYDTLSDDDIKRADRALSISLSLNG